MNHDTKWSIDQSHSEIAFKVRHMMIANVKGTFKTFEANIYTVGKDFNTAAIDVWIEASSIDTGDAKRDAHLVSQDFLNADNHKQITFSAATIEKGKDANNKELWGDLTINGISKRIKLNVEFGGMVVDPWGNEKAGFAITGKIKRADWELTWNTPLAAGGLMVSDEITIQCEIELTNAGKKDVVQEDVFASAKDIAI